MNVYVRATMKDVAALAGVGLATVSRVLNGVPVDPHLTVRVLDAARQLGYRKDTAATSLRRADRRTNTIGLVLQDVANPFSSALHRAVEDVGVQRGLLVLAGSSDEEPERERELLGVLRTRRVDGLIVVPTGAPDDELESAHRDGTPIVCVDRASPVPGVDTVTADNRGGVAGAVRALHALGHRRIGFVADHSSLWTARERHEGFAAAMAELGCRTRAGWVRRDVHTEDAARAAVTGMFGTATAPTALVTAQNWLTIGARRALVDLGLHHTVAHVGFDDFPLADMLDPPVSVIAQDPAEMGRRAALLLVSRLDGDDGPVEAVTLRTRYIARGSGELPPPATVSPS
ncbi:LacI family DNA-binding transcriptional regulator [Dactylosporangium siamense]|uniref:LacI family transcriptional regulator n=1 Tax=Dactylosporangium siamense TaxID=685454 RepID=A0A919PTA7_9ACTN|nr:LacI family DNA-binding transcriptional regulator [Dactylosporangium siamense]GIG49774.1 LacI family transcriptional regulator [Dactylosporangium siamense]